MSIDLFGILRKRYTYFYSTRKNIITTSFNVLKYIKKNQLIIVENLCFYKTRVQSFKNSRLPKTLRQAQVVYYPRDNCPMFSVIR